jgi:single-strand DNA-binding protein
MAGSVNKVILIGNLGADPEVKVFDDGNKLARISIATNESYKNRNGEMVDNTEWHNVILRRGLAGVAEQYLKRGDKIYVEGKLTTRKWTDKEGRDQYTTEIVVRDMVMLGAKTGSEGGGMSSGSSYGNPSSMNSANSVSNSPSNDTQNQGGSVQPAADDDDLPF